MNYYLIDYENVKSDVILDISGVKEGDTFVLFYSEVCKNISLEVLEMVSKKKLKFHPIKVTNGTKNALDFQLSSYLGYLIKNNDSDLDYFIVSNDKGYDSVAEFWIRMGVFVTRLYAKGTLRSVGGKVS